MNTSKILSLFFFFNKTFQRTIWVFIATIVLFCFQSPSFVFADYYPAVTSNGAYNCGRTEKWTYENGYEIQLGGVSVDDTRFVATTYLYYGGQLVESRNTVIYANNGSASSIDPNCYRMLMISSISPMTDTTKNITIQYNYWNGFGWDRSVQPTIFTIQNKKKYVSNISVSNYVFWYGTHFLNSVNLFDGSLSDTNPIDTRATYESNWANINASEWRIYFYGASWYSSSCNINNVYEGTGSFFVDYSCALQYNQWYWLVNGWPSTNTQPSWGTYEYPKNLYSFCNYDAKFCQPGEHPINKHPENTSASISTFSSIMQFVKNIFCFKYARYSLPLSFSCDDRILNANPENKQLVQTKKDIQNKVDPVNIETGEFTYSNTIYRQKDTVLPFTIDVNYRSQIDYDGIIGHNWSYNYDLQLTKNPDGTVTYANGINGSHTFAPIDDSWVNFYHLASLNADLTKTDEGYKIAFVKGLTYMFGNNNRIKSIHDIKGNTITFNYDVSNKITSVTDALGRTLQYSYNRDNRLTQILDTNGQGATFAYYGNEESNGLPYDLKSITITGKWSIQKTISFTYNTIADKDSLFHNIKDLIDAKNQVYVTNTYDENDRVLSQQYGSWSGRYEYTLADIHTDDTETTTGTGDVVGSYVAKNRVSDRNGNITEYVFNKQGNILSRAVMQKNGSVNTTTYTYNQMGQVLTETLQSGNGTEWKYDDNGNIIEKRRKTDMNTGDSAADLVELWEYESGSNLPTAYIDPNGNRKETTYNDEGLVMSETVKNYHNSNDTVTNDITTQYLYDNLWRRTQIISPTGLNTYYSYSGSSSLISSIQTGDGNSARTQSFAYDGASDLINTTDALGHTSTYSPGYFGETNMIQTASGVYHYTYQDFNNNTTYNFTGTSSWTFGLQYEYDSLDHVTKISEDYELKQDNTFPGPMGMMMYTISRKHTNIAYDANGNVNAKTYEDGSKTTYTYDEFDRIVSTIKYGSGYTQNPNSTGIETKYTYDENGNIATQINPNGFTIRYEYDGYNRPVKLYDNPSSYLQLTYDKNSNKVDEKRYIISSNKLVYWKHTTYNELGQSLEEKAYYINNDGSVDEGKTITVSPTYDNSGKLISVAKNGKTTTTNFYNEFGEITSSKDALGNEIRFTYDKNGQKTQEETLNSSGVVQNTFTYTYNADGQLIATTQVAADTSRTVSKEYNALGQVIATIDARGQKTSYTYDFLGNILSTQYPDGTSSQNEYNAMRQLIATTDEKGNKTTYEYDAFGNLSKKILPDQTADSYEYDQLGNVIKSTDANGTIKTYTYDAIGRLTDTTLVQAGTGVQSAPNTHREYDALGHLISITSSDNSQPLTFEYDGLGQLVRESQNGKNVSYTYNSDSLLDAIIYPSGRSISHHYDAADKLSTVTTSANGEILSNTYNGIFLQTKTTNGIQQQYTYDGFGRNTQISATNLFTENYTYNAADNLSTKNNFAYTYDTRDQLTSESESGALFANYSYDSAGNIQSYTNKNAQTTSYTTNALNQYTSDSQSGSYVYDHNGNLLEDSKHTYTYDTNNQLNEVWQKAYTSEETSTQSGSTSDCVSASGTTESGSATESGSTESGSVTESGSTLDGSGTTESGATCTQSTPQTITTTVTHPAMLLAKYSYDALGRRYEKTLTDNTKITYVYSGQDILEETTSLNGIILDTKEYIYGDGEMDDLEAIVQNNQVYTTLKDRQGSIRKVVDSSGNVIQSIDYDAYGNITSETGSAILTNRLYTGREYDRETGLYYLRARYYDAQNHRFLQRDPLGNIDSLNLYLYVKNNPLKWTDRGGKEAKAMLAVPITKAKRLLVNPATVALTTIGWGVLWLVNEDVRYGSEFLMNSMDWTTKTAYYDKSNYVTKFKTTPTYVNLQYDIANSIKKKGNSFTWSANSLDVFSKITLWEYNYAVTIVNQEVEVKITDTYDFNKEKDDSYLHTYLNILHDSQEQGIITPYKVEINLNYSIWK